MPESGFFDTILSKWQNGASVVGIALVLFFLFKYIGTPLLDRMDKNREERRKAAKEIRESEIAARQAEIDSRVKVAEAQRESIAQLASISADMKATVQMAREMHDACHARQSAPKTE